MPVTIVRQIMNGWANTHILTQIGYGKEPLVVIYQAKTKINFI